MQLYKYPPQPVSVSVPPIEFQYNGATQTVVQDTATPANNRALPELNFIIKDGVELPITKDTVTPANNIEMPVNDLAVQTAVDSINTKTPSLGQAAMAASVPVVIASDQTPVTAAMDGQIVASTSTPLGIGGVYTSAAFEVTKYAAINICVESNVASATDGVKVQFSTDGVTWPHSHQTTFTASTTGIGFIFNAEFRYARVVYTNGAVAQTNFNLLAIVKSSRVQSSLFTLDQSIFGGMFAELVKANLVAKNPGGTYVSIGCTAGGNLKAAIEEFDPGVFGQTTMSASLPVAIASDQSTLPISAASLPLPTGAATESTLATMSTKFDSIVSAANSTSTPLAGGATFTGAAVDTLGFHTVNVSVYTSHASAANGFTAQFSSDGVNWDHQHTFTLTAGWSEGYNFTTDFRYFRVVYTNGATPQTAFRLQTILKTAFAMPSTYSLGTAMNDDLLATAVKSVLTAKTPGGSYVSIDCTTGGNLKMAVEEFDPAVLGSKTSANSLAVVIASDQSTIPVSAASLPLPTGAATEATLAAMSAKLPAALGQTTSAASLAVVPASDYVPPASAVPTALTLKNATITLTTAGTAYRATTDGAAPSATRRKLRIFVDPDTVVGTGKFYLGASTVTSSGANKGEQIFPGAPIEFIDDANDYYIVSDVSAQPVSIIEVE